MSPVTNAEAFMADRGATVNLAGESGHSQITFGVQKLQLRHANFIVKIQLFVARSKRLGFKKASGRGNLRRPE
jgi:hypothetical protein